MARGKFTKRGNAGTATCRSCKVTFQKANLDYSTELCDNGLFSCFEISGQENAHYDGVHAATGGPYTGKCPDSCPVAHPGLEALLDGRAFRLAKTIAESTDDWNVDSLAIALAKTFEIPEGAAYHVAELVHERVKSRKTRPGAKMEG